MRKFAIVAALTGVLIVGASSSGRAAGEGQWRDYIEAVASGAQASANVAAGELIPPGTGDIANALMASPDTVKAGLGFWLRTKMQSAVLDDDMRRLDRYQAFYTCLTAQDCERLRGLTADAGSRSDEEATSGGSRYSTWEGGQNRLGGDYAHFAMANASPEECQNACVRAGRCVAWTYVRPGVQGDTAVCWLKDSVPDLSDNNCCTSGKIMVGQVDR